MQIFLLFKFLNETSYFDTIPVERNSFIEKLIRGDKLMHLPEVSQSKITIITNLNNKLITNQYH
jgi:hypothetical protein